MTGEFWMTRAVVLSFGHEVRSQIDNNISILLQYASTLYTICKLYISRTIHIIMHQKLTKPENCAPQVR